MAASVRTFVRSLSRKNAGFSAVLRLSDCRWFSGKAEERSTHFGFETVSETEKASKVYKVFENVAQKYDVMNDAMSLGIHRLWKDALLHVMHPQPGARLLDVAGGTGDIAFRFLEYVRSQQERQQRRAVLLGQTPSWQDVSDRYPDGGGAPESAVVVCDINKEMLKVGRQRADSRGVTTGDPVQLFLSQLRQFSQKSFLCQHLVLSGVPGLSWVVGDAEELPFNDDQFDLYTIAFGIRNVTHIDQALKEALRVLKPGGRFLCLEFSKVTNPVLERLYDVYSFQVIPVLGEVIAGDWKSYQYLVESIRKFPDQEEFKGLMEDSGFFCVQYFNLTGGVVALHSGFKL